MARLATDIYLNGIRNIKRGVFSFDQSFSDGIVQQLLVDSRMMFEEHDSGQEVVVLLNLLQIFIGKDDGSISKLHA